MPSIDEACSEATRQATSRGRRRPAPQLDRHYIGSRRHRRHQSLRWRHPAAVTLVHSRRPLARRLSHPIPADCRQLQPLTNDAHLRPNHLAGTMTNYVALVMRSIACVCPSCSCSNFWKPWHRNFNFGTQIISSKHLSQVPMSKSSGQWQGDKSKQETYQETTGPNVTSLYFVNPLAFNATDGGVPLGRSP